MKRRPHGLAALLAASVILGGGCDGRARVEAWMDAGGPARGFAETCGATEDCASGLCLELSGDRAICTRRCEADGDCPGGPNWGCVTPVGFAGRVCGCVPDSVEEVCGDGIDNDCDDEIDDCRLCDGVPVPEDSPQHCGRCGHACRADQECHDGSCRCAAPGTIDCSGVCVDPRADEANCGACGTQCEGGGQQCVDGACACPEPTPDLCDGECVDTRIDRAHCGSCGVECDAAFVCAESACACPAGGPLDACPGIGCVDLSADADHCGACGASCRPGETCASGSCRCPITDQVWCDGFCRDVRTDVLHCGACGNACLPGERCASGACVCDSGLICGGMCVAPDDPRHCGGCGLACRADQRCIGGTCACASGTDCGGVCVSLSSSSSNCGACGNVCLSGMYCSAGVCRCSSSSSTYCPSAGGCVETGTDEAHCGTCDAACSAVQACSGGRCVCPTTGTTYCATSDRCVDLQNDPANCGACGTTCSAATICRFGSCRCAISGQTYCSAIDACVDLQNDGANCGSCGAVCPAETSCSLGRCRCDGPGLTLCGTSCYDLQNDALHCGSCTRACTGGRTCMTGSCWCAPPSVGTEVRLTTTLTQSVESDMVGTGTQAGLVWREANQDLSFTIVDATGARAIADVPVVTGSEYLSSPRIAWNGTEWGVVWRESRASRHVAMFQRFSSTGAAIGAPIELTAGWGTGDPGVSQVRIAWAGASGWGAAIAHASLRVSFQGIGVDGSTLPFPVLVRSGGSTSLPGLEIAGGPDGRFGILCASGSEFQIIAADGSLAGSRVILAAALGEEADLAHDGQTWIVAGRRIVYRSSVGYAQSVVLRGETLTYAAIIQEEGIADLDAWSFSMAVQGDAIIVLWETRVYWSWPRSSLVSARLRVPSGATGAPTIVSPPATYYPMENADSLQLPTIAWTGPDRVVGVWSDLRWGQNELSALPGVVATCM